MKRYKLNFNEKRNEQNLDKPGLKFSGKFLNSGF